ncbi:hypothetical protein QJQ45_011549 [Haematococcus lacustris]|nr:hypothetical protein QJQ45_011549 [Haematococcus lacustris]
MLVGQQRASLIRAPKLSRSRSIVRPTAFLQQLFKGSGTSASSIDRKKEKLLEVIAPLKRGAAASAEDMAEVEQACRALEAVNPTRNPLSSPLVNGKWEYNDLCTSLAVQQLLYTTSASILGTSRPPFLRPSGPIYQTIDAPAGKARNQETAPFFNTVAADITPMSSSKLAVKFTQFKLLGLLPITAPDSAWGELAVTFLDEELRISRGASGSGQQVIAERDLVEAARPHLSPAQVDAVVAEVNKRMAMGSKQCVLAAVLSQAPPAQTLSAAPGPVPRPQAPPWGRWLDRDTNGCYCNLQRIGESKQRPPELCQWDHLEALPPVGEEYQQGFKLINDRLPKVRQRLHGMQSTGAVLMAPVGTDC